MRVKGSTVSITNIEFEPGLLVDFPEALQKIAPVEDNYHHDEMWHHGNGYSHVRASIVGNSTHIPLIDGVLQMGQWQQVVLVDFDNKLYIAFYDVPILSIDSKWTQEDILKKLEEVRNTYIKYYTQKLNYEY